MLFGLDTGSLMMSKGPEGILLMAEKDGRRAVAIQTSNTLFTLTGKVGGASSALFARRKTARPATAIGGTWSQSVAQEYDLEGWAKQVLNLNAEAQMVAREWLPKDAFSPISYLHDGDLIQIAERPVLVRFDPLGGPLDVQAERQEAVDKFLRKKKVTPAKITLVWFDKTLPNIPLEKVEVLQLDPRDGFRKAIRAETWALIDRTGRIRATGSAETLAERLKTAVTEE